MRATHRSVPVTAIIGWPAAVPACPASARDGVRSTRPLTLCAPLDPTFDPGLPGNLYAPRAAVSRTGTGGIP
jgi:hypothetical protein